MKSDDLIEPARDIDPLSEKHVAYFVQKCHWQEKLQLMELVERKYPHPTAYAEFGATLIRLETKLIREENRTSTKAGPLIILEAAQETVKEIEENKALHSLQTMANSTDFNIITQVAPDKPLKLSFRNQINAFLLDYYTTDDQGNKNTPEIVIACDLSGSTDDEILSDFNFAINVLSHLGNITIVPFDAEVDETQIVSLKKHEYHQLKRTISGGTDYNAPTDWVNKNAGKFDLFLIATDMMGQEPQPSIVPRVWLKPNGCSTVPWKTSEPIIEI